MAPTAYTVLDIQVPCPHCTLGRVLVQVKEQDGASTVIGAIGAQGPRKCAACGKYVAIKMQISLYAVPFEPGKDPTPVSPGDLLRNLIGGG